MNLKKTIYISIFFLSFSHVISAQDSIQSTTPTVDDRIKSVEKAISFLPKISGLLNLRYQYSTEAANYNAGKNGFDVRRAYLDFKGNATNDLTYRLQIDFATSPKIIDAYVEWKPFKFIGLQAGQFK